MANEEKQDKLGFQVGTKFFPFPVSFRACDPVLVTELTGLTWNEFLEAMADEERAGDPVVAAGLLGVAVWQANPRWRRDRVVREVQQIEVSDVDLVGGEELEKPAPLAPEDGSESSPESLADSSATSPTTETSTSGPSIPPTSGVRGSDIGSQA